jgi:hypothetical protein
MATAQAVHMRRHLMNLLPALQSCAPALFLLALVVLALTTTLAHLAHLAHSSQLAGRSP